MFHFRAYHFGAYHFRSATTGGFVPHDVFAQEPPPKRIRRIDRREQLRELEQALKQLEERLAKEREEALVSNILASEEMARRLAADEMQRIQLQAALLNRRKQDDEEAIAMLLLS